MSYFSMSVCCTNNFNMRTQLQALLSSVNGKIHILLTCTSKEGKWSTQRETVQEMKKAHPCWLGEKGKLHQQNKYPPTLHLPGFSALPLQNRGRSDNTLLRVLSYVLLDVTSNPLDANRNQPPHNVKWAQSLS